MLLDRLRNSTRPRFRSLDLLGRSGLELKAKIAISDSQCTRPAHENQACTRLLRIGVATEDLGACSWEAVCLCSYRVTIFSRRVKIQLGRCFLVSGIKNIAAIPTRLLAMRYQAGDSGFPVATISQVTITCALPPNTVTAVA